MDKLKEEFDNQIESLNEDWEKECNYGEWDENDNFIFNKLDNDKLFLKISPYIKHSIKITPKAVKKNSTLPSGISRLGGRPDLPPHFKWPHWPPEKVNGKLVARNAHFTAQINLNDVAGFDTSGVLPEDGILYFFSDGFFPFDDGWKVLYYNGDVSTLKEQEPPGDDYVSFNSCLLTFSHFLDLPPPYSIEILDLDLNDQEIEALHYISGWNEITKMLGYPLPFQGPHLDFRMWAEAARRKIKLNSVYAYKDKPCYMDSRTLEIEKKAKDWILLFQLASEREANMNWIDAGILYFLIKKDDLEKRNFDNMWYYSETH